LSALTLPSFADAASAICQDCQSVCLGLQRQSAAFRRHIQLILSTPHNNAGSVIQCKSRDEFPTSYLVCHIIFDVITSGISHQSAASVAAPELKHVEDNMKKLVLAVLLSVSTAAFANSACDKPKNDFDSLYCLNKVYQEADKELNSNFQKLSGKLDGEGKKALKKGQLAWIQDRNQSCSKTEPGHFYVDLQCATDTTIARAQFLQNRVRECTSAGCQNSKL